VRLSLSQLVALATKHGFADPELAAAIAMAESGGDTGIPNDTRQRTDLPAGIMQEDSVGLWQINRISSPSSAPTKYASWDLADPDVNAQAAFEISSGGTRWIPGWTTTVRNGSYKKFYLGSGSLDPKTGIVYSDAISRDFQGVRRPTVGSKVGPTIVVAVALAAAAGYAASEWRRFT
jgi:Lysozyme like domain